MGKMTVAGVYGQAMFDVARDGDILETVREELNDLQEIFSKETDFFQLLTAEAVSKKEKLQWIEEIFKDKISEKTLSFLCVLIEKRRFSAFTAIVKEYNRLVEEKNLISRGTVFSVIPLSESKIEEMEIAVGKLLKKNKVKLDNIIDEKLIGGFAIQIEGHIIDASMNKRMQNLTLSVKNGSAD